MEIREDFSLAPLTTLKVGGPAKYFVEAKDSNDVIEALAFAKEKRVTTLIIGGGSNVVISDEGFSGLVLQIKIRGFEKISEDKESALIKFGSGEVWDEVVQRTVALNLWGIENLSHIPGLAGAFTVQNVGAYGVEASDVVESVEVFDTKTGKIKKLSNTDCEFGYRKSIFNSSEGGRYIILATIIRLSKEPKPNLRYVDLIYYFSDKKTNSPTQTEIRKAVIEIRDRKFPFPKTTKGGNAGSFFKNLLLTEAEFQELEKKFMSNFGRAQCEELKRIRHKFPDTEGIKIPTAFLIDVCGLKGFELSGIKINESHPLVLLNQGEATAKGVMEMFRTVRRLIYEKTGLEIINEPELVGFKKEDLDYYFSLE